MKNKANKGWLKEIKSGGEKQTKSSFSYSNPLVTPKRIKSVQFKSESREVKTSSDITVEQNKFLDNKGKLNGK